MNANEFMYRLDLLYNRMDLLKEKLRLRANSDILIAGAQHMLGREILKLFGEYFEEAK